MKKNTLLNFLSELDITGIPYVSWKNNHELDDYLDGKGDLDLFIPSDYRAAFMFLAIENKWIELQNPVASFPSVCHFFRLGNFGKIHHLHVYFQIVTGESWLKEFVLPLDEFLLSNRVKTINTGIWILRPEAQRYMFALRHLLKGGALSSRWLYRRELSSYAKEFEACGGPEGWDPELGPISLSDYTRGSRLLAGEFRLPSIVASMRLRLSLAPFLRVSFWTLPARRFVSFLNRALNKLVCKRKKIFLDGGLVIAISGVDGSGKSTMLGAMSQFFSRFLTVENFQLGRPQGRFLELLRKLVGRQRQREGGSSVNASQVRSLPRAIAAATLAWVRLRTAQRALRMARRGYLVLSDRWPSADLGKMDGPRIAADISEQNGLVAVLGRFEQWAYSRIPRADVCIVLIVSLESALVRNRDRIKEEKESDDDIRRRFEENQAPRPIANKIIRFVNDSDFEDMRKRLLQIIWTELASH